MAVKNDPKNTMYINNLADVWRLKGEPDQAIENLKKSLKLNARGMATHFNLGMAYKDLKEYEKAIESFKQSLKVNIA